MLTWRAIAASAIFLAASVSSSQAAPGSGSSLSVPIEISGLPAGIDLVTLNCYVTDAEGRIVAGGNTQDRPIGGRLAESMSVPLTINRSATQVTGIATGYWCRVALSGTTPQGYAVTFWNSTALTTAGWRNVFAPREQTTYMPAARGATNAMEIRGTLTVEQGNTIAPPSVTACTCGCGATTGSMSSACSSTVTRPGGVPVASGRLSVRGATTPALRASTTPPPPPGMTITTPAFRFTGTGVFTRG